MSFPTKKGQKYKAFNKEFTVKNFFGGVEIRDNYEDAKKDSETKKNNRVIIENEEYSGFHDVSDSLAI